MSKHKIKLINKLGLHARAASKLVQCSSAFESRIEVSYNNKTVDAKSIMSVMLLAASVGSTLTFQLQGKDAEQAWLAIKDLIERRFDEPE